MFLSEIKLRDFRSYERVSFHPSRGITVLTGQNGAGKTNLLESIHICCLGRSHRTAFDRELIRQGAESAVCEMTAEKRDGGHTVRVLLSGDSRRLKDITVNGKRLARIGEMMGHINCVLFSPEDLLLLREGPSCRRRYMDMALSQIDARYFYVLQRYAGALKQRNALLKQIAAGERGEDELLIWDEQLAQSGETLCRFRRRFASSISPLAKAKYAEISKRESEELEISYVSQVKSDSARDEILTGLLKSRREDIRFRTTAFGVHHDDLRFTLCGQEMKNFASQGQKRTAVLALKLAQLSLMEAEIGEKPLLLLDDVLSELDSMRREYLLASMDKAQTFVTCTDETDLSGAKVDAIIRVSGSVLEY
ncbi:MAG: DNA replication/repair protein RecF [Eubacteriales bacterium]|nr:DNA replication/repair protein RecF [Eubacteriales bacterium]MDD3880773.1 DNA replication/repair protein RecF [Eubacteriales bacterium]MDD3882880.1 DNA replication/repair protein RecF [Eubacteriales bacterium]MDD4511594.1 DNA replication/repair protein RecF [Eubacteriales bacterium]